MKDKKEISDEIARIKKEMRAVSEEIKLMEKTGGKSDFQFTGSNLGIGEK